MKIFDNFSFKIATNIYDMFKAQPLLTASLFGVPIAFLSLITYCLCSTDFSVDRDEIYPDEDVSDTDGSGKFSSFFSSVNFISQFWNETFQIVLIKIIIITKYFIDFNKLIKNSKNSKKFI